MVTNIESSELSMISRLAIRYMSCFPIDWHKRIAIYWKPKNNQTNDIIFAIAPIPNHPTNVDFVKNCLLKSFVILSCSQHEIKLRANHDFDTKTSIIDSHFTVVILNQIMEPLGSYYVFETQKCNVKHFLKSCIYPFYFKQPKHFICMKRPRKKHE
jgi:hypothetical protein